MSNVIPFPERQAPPPERGYCSSCRIEMAWPRTGAWPESCPQGCTPLVIQSTFPEPGVMQWTTAQGPPMDVS